MQSIYRGRQSVDDGGSCLTGFDKAADLASQVEVHYILMHYHTH